MTRAHRLTPHKKVLSQDVAGVPLNFLLGASDRALDDYELARLAAIADLRQAATVPSKTTGNRALRELLSAGKIRRIGKARSGRPFRYFK